MNYKEKVLYKALCTQKASKIASACWEVTLTTFRENRYKAFIWSIITYPFALIYALYVSFSASPAKILQIKSMCIDNNDDVIGFKLLTYYEGD